MATPLFHEKQQFRQWWIWLILISVTGYSGYQAISTNDSYYGLAISGSLLILFLVMRLETSVYSDHINIKFFPFINRSIYWKEVNNMIVRKYSALGEFGGWGIRFRRGGIAYNVDGNKGLELTLQDNRKIMIGTQHPDELKSALPQLQEN